MKEKIIEILGVCIYPELADLKADQIMALLDTDEFIRVCKILQDLKPLWLPNTENVSPEHYGEIEALTKAAYLLDETIKKFDDEREDA